MYMAASFISLGPIFLPRYSGVRPTMSPAMKTAMMDRISMPYSPEPVPPGATSPSIMFTMATPPAKGDRESWATLTAPVEVSVVDAAKIALVAGPKRCSKPSPSPPAAAVAAPWPADTAQPIRETEDSHRAPMTAATVKPCFWSPTIRPYAYGRAEGISRSRKTWNRLMKTLGFSNG